MTERAERVAADARLTVAARIGVLVLAIVMAPQAGWTLLQVISLMNRTTAIETTINHVPPPIYTPDNAARDLQMRDMEIGSLAKTVDNLVSVVGVIQQRQSERTPLFAEMAGRLDKLEAGQAHIGQLQADFSNMRRLIDTIQCNVTPKNCKYEP